MGYGGAAENVRLPPPKGKRTRGTLSILVAILAFQAVYFIITLYLGRYRLDIASPVALQTSVSAEKAAEKKHYKTYLFYDAGAAYHDMNFTCPVPWVCFMILCMRSVCCLIRCMVLFCSNGHQICPEQMLPGLIFSITMGR